LLHWKPLLGNFQVHPGVGQGSRLQALPEVRRALSFDELQHRAIDKSAAVAFRDNPIQHGYSGIGQDDIDAFTHGDSVWLMVVVDDL